MKSLMFTLLLSASLASPLMAMEPEKPMVAPAPKEQTFKDIQRLFQEYMKLNSDLIIGLNQLLDTYKLENKDKESALTMAENLQLYSLEVPHNLGARIRDYDQGQQPNVLHTLPSEAVQKILSYFSQGSMKSRSDFIIGISQLLANHKLENKDKEFALEIAQALQAPNLEVRISAYDKNQKHNAIGTLPPDVVDQILGYFSEGKNAQDIVRLLRTSKNFNMALLQAPVDIYLNDPSNFFGRFKITDKVLADIIATFPNMRSLTLDDCPKITQEGFSPVSKLANLTTLSLKKMNITDLSPLQNLTNLTKLDVEIEQESELDSEKPIDISPLQNLKKLTYLSLSKSPISDISIVQGLPNLTTLILDDITITNIDFVKGLPNLTTLKLCRAKLSDISPLENLTNLTELDLSENRITDLRPLQNLTNLTKLYLESERGRHNTLDISPLQNLIKLTILNLGGNNIKDLSPLHSLTNLTDLELPQNTITDAVFQFLQNLPKLTILRLSAQRKHDQAADLGRFQKNRPNIKIY
jgi:internalin A